MRRLAFLLLLFACPAQAADALVLSCMPLKSEGAVKIDAYLDAFSNGNYPPKAFESVRLLARFGEDVYEFFPDQTKLSEVRDGVLRLHQLQPLSAGETAEVRIEGKIPAKKAEPFTMQMHIRGEKRTGQARLRCTIE
jgi:hypothetical protein